MDEEYDVIVLGTGLKVTDSILLLHMHAKCSKIQSYFFMEIFSMHFSMNHHSQSDLSVTTLVVASLLESQYLSKWGTS